MSDIRERIDKGVALLDRKAPGWRAHVDAEGLHLADCRECVLGQMYGQYQTGLRALGLVDGYRFGFTIESDGDARGDAARFGALTKAWRRIIRGQS